MRVSVQRELGRSRNRKWWMIGDLPSPPPLPRFSGTHAHNRCVFLEYKLMYGMLFSIRSFVSKMSPVDMKDGFLAFQTSRYKLHYYETPTGVKVVMNTDLGVGPIRDVLHHIYSGLYVELVVKNPLCPLGQTVQSELFRSRLDAYIRSLPFFSARAG
ncbi:trafficking protein particle complex subunit 1 isoform X3 [Antechinus flavipes]|uniref:trafficking protein particle complex subunit 1 isoform X3 n=1 Tax=Antechinus flavipes TaxID=38775 RepID=UPI002235C387|nr:trafficking protein particle complex subunit 1 isoform X3 [Antechinus flavipes]